MCVPPSHPQNGDQCHRGRGAEPLERNPFCYPLGRTYKRKQHESNADGQHPAGLRAEAVIRVSDNFFERHTEQDNAGDEGKVQPASHRSGG